MGFAVANAVVEELYGRPYTESGMRDLCARWHWMGRSMGEVRWVGRCV